MEALGLCLGASTVSLVHLIREAEKTSILRTETITHEGNPRKVLLELLDTVPHIHDLPIAVTGRKFINFVKLTTISEPEALETAVAHVVPKNQQYKVVVSAGGETFLVYHLDDEGKIQGIQTGNKCASGTGEFFLQQIGRMNLNVDDVAEMGISKNPHKVSGRCSVFCKSDCTHALNKGVPKRQVVAGLAKMMAGKVLELLKKLPKNQIMLVGGSTNNQVMIHYLGREIEDLFIPPEAPYFEALGAALWALDNRTEPYRGAENVFRKKSSAFGYLKPLEEFRHLVHFNDRPRGQAKANDRTILGLDVGSTTTKGVIMRLSDKAILAADYLRTDGDPVGASRRVYQSLATQIDVPIGVVGLGVTGSGRQIAGLHAMTEGVINEIIAHAAAAVHFDKDVDTIFEIGGQDAKYTYITNGVPSDYAMNEACSAGTGSFLEESAKESLGLKVTDIGSVAYTGKKPPNFNDQCAAFIGSDIKNAAQEGIPVNDIVAGLVYSICMNYSNRVKGNRPVGKKVFMQGGVCYNEAIPAAMAALTGKEIVVPPEPGLMGAFGVALEVERRIEVGLMKEQPFDLEILSNREVNHKDPFTCGGGKEKCDLRCEIARIEIEGKTYPFGGACNRYVNLIRKLEFDKSAYDMVTYRQRQLFKDLEPEKEGDTRTTIGVNRSFLINTYFPLFNAFFRNLGYRVIVSEKADPAGVDQQGAAFCFPVEISHGMMHDLISKNPDVYFLPHIRGVPTDQENSNTCTCVFVQGECFYLKSTFDLGDKKVLTPYLDLSRGIRPQAAEFIKMAAELGHSEAQTRQALEAGIAAQDEFKRNIQQKGREMIAELDADPSTFGIVLFGRPYNSFTIEANKGIPAKFASRGFRVLPFDMLPYEEQSLDDAETMYWSMGRMILKAARFAKNHPNLFGTFISNFSCGPDSFVVGYFRDEMGKKPSLTLELDSHTADAGLETRIEAFLDIVRYYRELENQKKIVPLRKDFQPARTMVSNGTPVIATADGRKLPLTDSRVRIVLPAMGRFAHEALVKTFQKVGINAYGLPPADEEVLKIGRGNSTCKECLPLQTTVGSMLKYLWDDRPSGEVTAYFMPGAGGPCRFGQYNVFSRRLIERHRIPDVAVLTLNASNGYMGLGDRFTLPAWRSIVIGDVMYEIWSTLCAAAKDKQSALQTFFGEWQAIVDVIQESWFTIRRQLKSTAQVLRNIALTMPYEKIPKISLIGEIYVRNDPISLQNLVEKMAEKGFVVRTSQTSEWIKYVDWLIRHRIEGDKPDIPFWIRYHVKHYFDKTIRDLLAPSNLFFHEVLDVNDLINAGKKFVSPKLTGEAILTVGAALHEILHPSCGIISIGPFGCMPTRVAESILSEKFTTTEKLELLKQTNGHGPTYGNILNKEQKLPFLAIETDGNAFPQIIEARLEAFALQARRLHEKLLFAH